MIGKAIGAVFVAAIAFAALMPLMPKDMQAVVNGPPPTAAEQRATAQAAKNDELFGAARLGVKAQLKDPGSAKFARLFITKKGVVCGTVNAKNSFGGYTGNGYFIADHGLVFFDRGTKDFHAFWKAMCVDHGLVTYEFSDLRG
jgi:hypothetical protein